MEFEDNRLILISAFRYALGRRTYITCCISDEILNNWEVLSKFDKSLFAKEIKEHKELYGNLGDKCDHDSWWKIVIKYEKEINDNF